VEVDNADVGAVPGEEAAAFLGRNEGSDLRRNEPSEMRPLTLHGLEQPCVPDCNRALIREGRNQFDLPLVEWSNLTTTDLNHADELVFDQHGRPEHRPDGSQL